MDVGIQDMVVARNLDTNKVRSWKLNQQLIDKGEKNDSSDNELEKISVPFAYNALKYEKSTPTQEETLQRVTKNRSIYSSFLRRANTARTSLKSFTQKQSQMLHRQSDDQQVFIEEREGMPEQPHDVSYQLATKIRKATDNFIGSKVKGLNGSTIEQYLEMMETNFPVEPEDWPELAKKMRLLCQKGPTVRIKCDRGKLDGYKKMDNIKLVAFFKPHNNLDPPTVEGVCVSTGNGDDNFEFNLNESLLVPGFANDTIRIEVRKIKTKGISARLLVGYVELKLADIPSHDYFQSYHALFPSDKGSITEGFVEGAKRLSTQSTDCPGYLNLSLIQERSEVHANQSVPEVLAGYFWNKAKQVFEIDHKIEIEPKESPEKVSYFVSVNQNMSIEAARMEPWQKRVTVEGDSRKVKDQSVTFPLECILTDQIELGTDSRRRGSVSPKMSKSSLSPSSSPSTLKSMKFLSPSISSLLSPKRLSVSSNGSLSGSTLSLSDMTASSMKSIKKQSRKLSDDLGKAFENFNISETLSVDRGISKVVKLNTCLPMGSIKPYTLPNITSVSWTLEIKSKTADPITSDEYQLLMVRAILKKLETENPDTWDGTFQTSVNSIFNILDASTEESYVNKKEKKGKSFIMAHASQRFNNTILVPYIENIVEASENDNDGMENNSNVDCLESYKNYAVDVLSDYMKPDGDKKLQKDVLCNIKLLLQIDPKLEDEVKETVSRQVSKLFKVWKEGEKKSNSEEKKCENMCQYELCNRMLIQHVIPDLYSNKHPELIESNGHQEDFEGIFNYVDFLADVYIDECKAIIKDPILDENMDYNEDDPLIQTHLAAYNCFSSFRNVLQYSKSNDHSWLYQMFDKYAKIWINMALSKANIHVDNLINIIKDKEQENLRMNLYSGPSLSRQSSSMLDDSAQGILYQFHGISETVWIFWKELEWANIVDNFKNGSNLILGLSTLEAKIINEYHQIHVQDACYDSKELSNDIELLCGIKKGQRRKVDAITELHTQVANGDLTEVDMNMCKTEIEKCHATIEDRENEIKILIETRIKLFCQKSIQPQIKKYVQDKNIESEGDCLLEFMDKVFKQLNQGMRRLETVYVQRTIGELWNAMEQEVLEHFKKKKERNLHKNKPERFSHIKESINSLIAVKNDLYAAGMIMCDGEKCFKTLKEVREDVLVLTGTPDYLIKMVLRKKTMEQKVDFGEEIVKQTEKSVGQITMKIGYMKEDGNVQVEIKSLHDIKLKEGKKDTKIKIQLRFYPDRHGKEVSHESRTYKDVSGSIVFDMEEDKDPLKYKFGVNHTISGTPLQKQMQDIFVTVVVLDCTKKNTHVGEVVVQLLKNGVLMPELPEVSREGDFEKDVPSLKYHLNRSSSVYSTGLCSIPEYDELTRRDDSTSTRFVALEKSMLYTK